MADEERITSVVNEYRIHLPLSVDEFKIGQLYSTAEASKNETAGGEGIEIVTNEPFEGKIKGERSGVVFKGQYTYKIFHLQSKVPAFIRALAPSGSPEVHEKSWNAYPYVRTEYSNPYMKENFVIIIESKYEPGSEEMKENAFNISTEAKAKRQIVKLDIVNDEFDPRDYKESEDPRKFKSTKTGRGPISGTDWLINQTPLLRCYKLYYLEFKWFGLQNKVELMLQKSIRRILLNFHRRVFCWIDQWYGMSIDDVRVHEAKAKDELDEARSTGEVKGMIEN